MPTPAITFNPNGSIQSVDYDQFAATHPEPQEGKPQEGQQQQPAGLIDYEALYKAASDELKSAHALLAATRAARDTSRSDASGRPSVTREALQGRLRPFEIARLTDTEVAQAVGLETVRTKDEVMSIVGADADKRQMEYLHKTDVLKYRRLREFGRIRNWL